MNHKTAELYLETEENVLGSIKYTFSGKQIAEMMEAYADQFRKKEFVCCSECRSNHTCWQDGLCYKSTNECTKKDMELAKLAQNKKMAENRIQEEYYNQTSPHFRDNVRYADAVKSINEKYKEALEAIENKGNKLIG